VEKAYARRSKYFVKTRNRCYSYPDYGGRSVGTLTEETRVHPKTERRGGVERDETVFLGLKGGCLQGKTIDTGDEQVTIEERVLETASEWREEGRVKK
jgi:hypothetical protein